MFFKKLLSSVLSFFRENYKMLIFFMIFYIVITFPLPYYVFTSGGITDLSKRFEIENGYTQKGSYNLSYVNQLNGNVLTYLISCIVPGMERVDIGNYQVNEDETYEELAIRDNLMLVSANQYAVDIAYTKANKNVTKTNFKLYVMAIYDILKSDVKIKIGDIITEANGTHLDSYEELRNVVNNTNVGDSVVLTLVRGSSTYTANVEVIEIQGGKYLGFQLFPSYDMEVEPKIKFNFKSSESGSSAGFMTALAIYDTLIEEDLTAGLKIAGTGTINSDGTVGPIGGVPYKLGGAVNGDADIFFIPSGENYEEAIKIKEEKNYDIEIVEIRSFDDAIEYLKSIKSEKE